MGVYLLRRYVAPFVLTPARDALRTIIVNAAATLLLSTWAGGALAVFFLDEDRPRCTMLAAEEVPACLELPPRLGNARSLAERARSGDHLLPDRVPVALDRVQGTRRWALRRRGQPQSDVRSVTRRVE